jgi:hypothetical protein
LRFGRSGQVRHPRRGIDYQRTHKLYQRSSGLIRLLGLMAANPEFIQATVSRAMQSG